jgi:hypothetical protein
MLLQQSPILRSRCACTIVLYNRNMSLQAAGMLFETMHLERWAFDIEIVYLCERLNIPMVELPVNWHEVDGSKLITNKVTRRGDAPVNSTFAVYHCSSIHTYWRTRCCMQG